MAFFQHILIPIASEEDAQATCAALQPYITGIERVTAVHVIEQREGIPDKAPSEKRQEDAKRILSVVKTIFSTHTVLDTKMLYETDIVTSLFSEATNVEADAIVFRARGGSRIKRILAGDITTKLVTDPIVPVISLPNPNENSS